jgi:hypothetical protein
MRFHFDFGHHHGASGAAGGVLVSHPSHLVVLDAHPTADHSLCPYLLDSPAIEQPTSSNAMKTKIRKQQQPQDAIHHPNPAEEDEDFPPLNVGRAEAEEMHERPKHRLFRLGRHRSRSSTNGEHKSLSPPPGRRRRSPKGRKMGLRRPTMKRSMSMPHDLKVASQHSAEVSQSCPVDPELHHEIVPKRGHSRTVTFSSVEIREYSRILGDHPCCPSGPPLALGWETERENSFRLEEYERKRDPVRRSKEDFRLGCQDRREILESLIISPTSSDSEGDSSPPGCCMYSRAEIRKAERRLNRERGENIRAVRKMNHRFFKPVDQNEIEKRPEDEKSEEQPQGE